MIGKNNHESLKHNSISKIKVLCWKKPLRNCDVNVGNIVISKLIETKTNSKFSIGINLTKL